MMRRLPVSHRVDSNNAAETDLGPRQVSDLDLLGAITVCPGVIRLSARTTRPIHDAKNILKEDNPLVISSSGTMPLPDTCYRRHSSLSLHVYFVIRWNAEQTDQLTVIDYVMFVS